MKRRVGWALAAAGLAVAVLLAAVAWRELRPVTLEDCRTLPPLGARAECDALWARERQRFLGSGPRYTPQP